MAGICCHILKKFHYQPEIYTILGRVAGVLNFSVPCCAKITGDIVTVAFEELNLNGKDKHGAMQT